MKENQIWTLSRRRCHVGKGRGRSAQLAALGNARAASEKQGVAGGPRRKNKGWGRQLAAPGQPQSRSRSSASCNVVSPFSEPDALEATAVVHHEFIASRSDVRPRPCARPHHTWQARRGFLGSVSVHPHNIVQPRKREKAEN